MEETNKYIEAIIDNLWNGVPTTVDTVSCPHCVFVPDRYTRYCSWCGSSGVIVIRRIDDRSTT